MPSLDILDYLMGLDAALTPRLPAGLRRQALREARRVMEAMAFRFAHADGRPAPEDLDYLRAIEAMKPAERAAEVLARRRPHYARVRRRRLATSWTILAIVLFAAGGLAYLATSEKAETLVTVAQRTDAAVTYSVNKTFPVDASITRLHVSADATLAPGSDGTIEVWLKDPDGNTALHYDARSRDYLRENVAPKPGVWTLLVDYENARGSITVEVDGVRPAR